MSANASHNPIPIRVLIVDDHPLLRDGLRLSLRQEQGLQIVGEARNGSEALRLEAELCPDVIVLDISLPDADGVDLARQFLARRPDSRIVILSGLLDRHHLDLALASGVTGFVLKTEPVTELSAAICKVARHDNYVSPAIAPLLVAGYKDLLATAYQNRPSSLSEREIMVLKLIADGNNSKEIAGKLGLCVKTIDTHRKRIMVKLGLHSVADLTKYAVREGYSPL